jgi:hypothetical protein
MAKLAVIEAMKVFMYENDHPPPHFHVLLAEHHAVIDIETMRVVRGEMPRAKLRAVLAWAKPRHARLLDAWKLVQAHKPVGEIV